jgi:integrase
MEHFAPSTPAFPPPSTSTSFRVYCPDEDDSPASDQHPDESRGKVSENIRLDQFYRRWFKPIVIDGEGLSPGTEKVYEGLLAWWKQLTSDPPLRLIDEFTVAAFAKRLRTATYKRGKLGQERPLGEQRAWILLRTLRALLNRIGPSHDPRKMTAALSVRMPVVPMTPVEPDLKAAFSLEQARRIVAAASDFNRPRIEGITPKQFWRGILAFLFVTGLRRGAVLKAEWSMLHRTDHWQLRIPGNRVAKTGKGKWCSIPDWAMAAIESWPRNQPQIFVFPHDVDHLNDLHYELQTIAGIPAEDQLSIQGWRRTHSNAMGDLGLDLATRLSQRALDHADAATTKRHYADFENRVRLKLPPLWDEAEVDDRQLLLFD